MINTFLPINKNHSMKMLLSSTPHSMVFLSKRFMHRIVNLTLGNKIGTMAIKPLNKIPSRNASFSGNTIKRASEETKKMNPQIPGQNNQYHKVIVITQCPKTDCNDKICPSPCAIPVDHNISGHLSSSDHLTPKEQLQKKAKKIAETNYKGENKPQFAITYNESYQPKLGELKPHKDSTDFLKNNLQNTKDAHDPDN
jgi:hypothetical protein